MELEGEVGKVTSQFRVHFPVRRRCRRRQTAERAAEGCGEVVSGANGKK